jgi:hypothetical protein
MNTSHTLTRIIAGTLLSGGVVAAGLGVAAGTAQARPGNPQGCTQTSCWCPGQPLPGHVAGDWDMNDCHDWHYSWHDDRQAPPGQVVQGPLTCGYGPGLLPQCAG